MRKMRFITLMTLLGVLLIQPLAFAEMIHGVVISADPHADYLRLTRTDLGTETTEELKITIPPDAELRGIESIAQLEPGDKIRVDGFKQAERIYEARAIEAL